MNEVYVRKETDENGNEVIYLDLNKPLSGKYENDEIRRLSGLRQPRKTHKEFITVLN
jgi:hypothetical protein